MIKCPQMLLIGATDRNVGKTTFSSAVIKHFSQAENIIALKITTVKKEEKGICPRGGKGCGVCSNLKANFEIIEEVSLNSNKDTSRMLKAGAKTVYWIKAIEESLGEAFASTASLIEKKFGQNTAIVCESNSIRKFIEPSMFIIMRKISNPTIKNSCMTVINYADKFSSYDPCTETFEFKPTGLEFNAATGWSFKENSTAIVLAGGKSERMGENKSLLSIGGKKMIEHIIDQLDNHFSEIIISSNNKELHLLTNKKIVKDKDIDKGPLMGILSCLEVSTYKKNFITACDIPEININLIHRMLTTAENYDIVVPIHDNKFIEPLFAVYSKNVLNELKNMLYNSQERKIRKLFDRVNTYYYPIDDTSWYKNINTKDDYKNFITDKFNV